jgi:hypothetical protein
MPMVIARGAASTAGVGLTDRHRRALSGLYGAHDWHGSVCDRVEGVQRYLDILRGILTPDDFELKEQRVSHVSDRVTVVELTETFKVEGVPTTNPECILVVRNDDGLIARVSPSSLARKGRGRSLARAEAVQHREGMGTRLFVACPPQTHTLAGF